MEVYVNYPTTEEGWKIFKKAVADVHAILVMKAIDDLPLNSISKRKVLKGVVEEAKRRAIEAEKKEKEDAKLFKKFINENKIDNFLNCKEKSLD